MSSWPRDLLFALRSLRRRPLSTLAIAATLALAVGAGVAVLRLLDTVVWRPLPFRADRELVRIYVEPRERGGDRLSPRSAVLLAVQRESAALAQVVGQRYVDLPLRLGDVVRRAGVVGVTAGWSAALGVAPRLGRAFTPAEEALGLASDVAIVSDRAWTESLGRRSDVLGARVVLGGRARTVVGVMPAGFRFPYDADFWLPLRADRDQVGPWGFFIVARLREGRGPADASREMSALAARLPDLAGRTLTAVPMREVLLGSQRRLATLLAVAMGVLLLLVCANLANLFLVRTLARERELALRAALGARRGRLARQLLLESLLVSVLGGGMGVPLAMALQPLLAGSYPADVDRLGGLPPLDARMLIAAATCSAACGLLFGALPAWRAGRQDPGRLLRSRVSASGTSPLLRGLLVGVEMALALTLLVTGGLLLRDLRQRLDRDLGYPQGGLVMAEVSLAAIDDPGARLRAVERIEEELRELRGGAVGATTTFPSPDGNSTASTRAEGEPETATRLVNHRLITPGFFPALGLRLVSGRGILPGDSAAAPPVAVVSASLARRRWPHGSAVGKILWQVRADEPPRALQVVGVVADVMEFGATEDTWYLPLAQHPASEDASAVVFVVRAAAPGLAPRIAGAVHDVDATLPVEQRTPAQVYADSLAPQRTAAALGSAFALLALLVGAVGVYAAMAAWVGERRREVAIRQALGGSRTRVVGEIARTGVAFAAAGVVAGGGLAAAGARTLAHWIPGLDVSLQAPLPTAAALLAGTALAASLLPAWRGSRGALAPTLREE